MKLSAKFILSIIMLSLSNCTIFSMDRIAPWIATSRDGSVENDEYSEGGQSTIVNSNVEQGNLPKYLDKSLSQLDDNDQTYVGHVFEIKDYTFMNSQKKNDPDNEYNDSKSSSENDDVQVITSTNSNDSNSFYDIDEGDHVINQLANSEENCAGMGLGFSNSNNSIAEKSNNGALSEESPLNRDDEALSNLNNSTVFTAASEDFVIIHKNDAEINENPAEANQNIESSVSNNESESYEVPDELNNAGFFGKIKNGVFVPKENLPKLKDSKNNSSQANTGKDNSSKANRGKKIGAQKLNDFRNFIENKLRNNKKLTAVLAGTSLLSMLLGFTYKYNKRFKNFVDSHAIKPIKSNYYKAKDNVQIKLNQLKARLKKA